MRSAKRLTSKEAVWIGIKSASYVDVHGDSEPKEHFGLVASWLTLTVEYTTRLEQMACIEPGSMWNGDVSKWL